MECVGLLSTVIVQRWDVEKLIHRIIIVHTTKQI
jgi:hypothetical protein